MNAWVELDGVRRRVGTGGLLLGRHGDCDLVLGDSRVSRHHALVRIGPGGLELIQLGRNASKVNGKLVEGAAGLSHGDEVALPGKVLLKVVVDQSRRDPVNWVVDLDRGGRFGLTRFPFTLGGGADDDLRLAGLPGGALTLRRAQGEIFVDAAVPMQLNGAPVEDESLTPVYPGDRVELEGASFRLGLLSHDGERVTVVPHSEPALRTLRLSFLPTGGRLVVETEAGESSVYLPERRFALIATLIEPPGDLKAGEFLPDEVICGRVWPRNRSKGREHVNVLLKRAREDLVKAGLNGFKLLERAQGGGATRFALPPGTKVVVNG